MYPTVKPFLVGLPSPLGESSVICPNFLSFDRFVRGCRLIGLWRVHHCWYISDGQYWCTVCFQDIFVIALMEVSCFFYFGWVERDNWCFWYVFLSDLNISVDYIEIIVLNSYWAAIKSTPDNLEKFCTSGFFFSCVLLCSLKIFIYVYCDRQTLNIQIYSFNLSLVVPAMSPIELQGNNRYKTCTFYYYSE